MTGETKFNFERIPVETVRRIAKELPVQSAPAIREPGHLRQESESKRDWQELALQVQQENNPKKMIHLVDQLIDALDRNKRRSDPLTIDREYQPGVPTEEHRPKGTD